MTHSSADDPSPLATLIRQQGEGVEELPLTLPVIHVGQATTNELVLDDDSVSSRHARIEFADGAWRIIDLESRNGTYLDGTRLTAGIPTPLFDRATLRLGGVELSFVSGDAAAAEAASERYTPKALQTPLAERSYLRLPLWLLVMVVLFVLALVALVLWFGGEPQVVPPLDEPITLASLAIPLDRLVA